MNKNKKGQMVIVQLLLLFMTIVVLIALIPGLKSILNVAKQSDNLNCNGFDYDDDGVPANNVLDYNSTKATDTLACLGINLYLPYLVIVILIVGITKVMYERAVG